jgi:flagellar hook protein FlgE
MSLMKSINTGLSGLNANTRGLGVVGDNIANANTVGFKSSRANFADMLAGTTLGIGSGVGIGSVQQQFSQGDFEMTGNALDVAISGPGFLMVNGEVGGREGSFYTRAGQFVLDNEGYVSTPEGLRLQGYGVDANGEVDLAKFGDLDVGGQKLPPKATSGIDLELNLDAGEEVMADPWDPANPGDTSNYSSTVTVYDSLGNPIEADIYYRKTGANSWEYKVLVDGETVSNGTPGTPSEIASGTLDFDTEGELATHTPAATNFQPVDATQPQDITIDFTGSTQVAGDSSLKSLAQDGHAVGELRDIIIEQDGTITGVFSNGENADIGRVAMADFQAPEGLERLGGRLWRATPQSGEAVVGAPGTGKMGAVISGALVSSNVDMSHEFVKMIAYQRGFQASSKAITTGDQLMSELINLKR